MKTKRKGNIIAFSIAYLCVLALLCTGVALFLFGNKEESVSRTENRTLQAYPSLSRESFFSGTYMDELESWMTDNIFSRDRLVNLSRSVLGVFDITSEEERAANMEGNLAATDSAKSEEPAAQAAPVQTDSTQPSTESVPVVQPTQEVPEHFADTVVENANTFLVRENGELVNSKIYYADGIKNVAAFLNEIQSRLGEDGNVYFLCTPISAVMNSVSQTKKYSSVLTTLDDEMQPLVNEGVTVCDEAEILGDRIMDDVFSVRDHHWTSLGASYTADWMINDMGLVSVGYYDYHHRLLSGLKDGAYDRSDLESMAPSISDLQFQIPLAPYDFTTLSYLEKKVACNYLADDPDGYWEYALYMGGCHGPYRLLETGFHTGRNALVIGDSFFQAFVPYIAPYYDTILMLDPRNEWYNSVEAGADLQAYMDLYDTSDVFFITCDTGTPIEGDTYRSGLPSILGTQP